MKSAVFEVFAIVVSVVIAIWGLGNIVYTFHAINEMDMGFQMDNNLFEEGVHSAYLTTDDLALAVLIANPTMPLQLQLGNGTVYTLSPDQIISYQSNAATARSLFPRDSIPRELSFPNLATTRIG